MEKMLTVFGFLGPEVVEFIDMREASIVFLTARQKKPGSTIKVRFALPNTKILKLDLSLRIASSRPNSAGKGHICVAVVLVPEQSLGELEGTLRTYGQRADLGVVGRRSH